jgi:phage tail-like protein
MLKQYIGLDLYTARRRILRDFPDLEPEGMDVTYIESPAPRFTVLGCDLTGGPGGPVLRIRAASGNPLRHLPSNYQENTFLRGFLMIFQHIMNDTSLTLDNLHACFRPGECPAAFLPVLADWLGIHPDTLGGEDEARRFLRYAIPLYRCRGTALGLEAHLAIVSGVRPRIIEGRLPYAPLVISETSETETHLFEQESTENCFTIFFPVPRTRFDESLIRRLSLIVGREKPAHTKCCISFAKPGRKPRRITTIGEESSMSAGGEIFI